MPRREGSVSDRPEASGRRPRRPRPLFVARARCADHQLKHRFERSSSAGISFLRSFFIPKSYEVRLRKILGNYRGRLWLLPPTLKLWRAGAMTRYNILVQLYLSNKEKRRRKYLFRLKMYGVFTILILLVAGAYFAVINIPFFKVQSIEVSGQEKLTKQIIINNLTASLFDNFWLKFLGFDNLLFWPKGSVTLNNSLIARADISKNWAEGKILLNIQEREKYGMWCRDFPTNESGSRLREANVGTSADQNDNNKTWCYWFDKEGIIFDRASEAEEGVIFRINNIDESVALPRLGDSVLGQDLFINLKKILEFLRGDFVIQNHQWNNKNFDLKSFTQGGVQLFFNTRFNPETNLKALKELSLKPFFKRLNYVDLRVENRVYYK